MKTCSRCKLKLDDSAFRLRRETRGKSGGGKLVYLNNTCIKCDAEIANKYYARHKDDPKFLKRWKDMSKKYYHNNRKTCTAKQKIYRDKNKDKRKAYDKAHKQKIKAQHAIVARKWEKYQRDNLTDSYCISKIRAQNGGKKNCEAITQEMIEQKRLSLKLKRQINEIRKADPSRSNAGPHSVLSGADIYRDNTQKYANDY